MNKALSRRDFIAGATVAGTGAALLGLASCSSGQKQAASSASTKDAATIASAGPSYSRLLDVAEKDVTATEETDIVVVGSGSAGTFAAVRAAERGANVIWLEKTDLKGGTSTITEGFTAFNAKQQVETGNLTDTQPIFNMLMDWHNWGAKESAFQMYFDHSNLATDWAIEHGAKLKYGGRPSKPHYGCFDENNKWMNIGTGMLTPLWEYGETLPNLDFRLKTAAVNIALDNGAVSGVYAKGEDGKVVLIKAKAVVMATGGFGGNLDMAKEWLRVPAERVTFLGFEGQDGDGILRVCSVRSRFLHSSEPPCCADGSS